MPVIRINKKGYEALQNRHKQTDVPISIIASKAIISALEPKVKPNPELKQSKSDPRLQEMKTIFFDAWERNNGFKPVGFGAIDISHLKQIIAKLDKLPDVTSVTDVFNVIMSNLPEWYKSQSLKVINSKLNELIAEIKRSKSTSNQSAVNHYGL